MKAQREIRTRKTIDLAMRLIANGRSGVYKEASQLSKSLSLCHEPEKVIIIQEFLFRKFNDQRSEELANAKDPAKIRETIYEWVKKFKIPSDVNPDELGDLLKEIDGDNCKGINHGICLRLNHRGSGRTDRTQAKWEKTANENKMIKFKEP